MSFTFSRLVLGLVSFLCLWSSIAHSQNRTAFDPVKAASQSIQTHLGLYVTLPARRDEGERVYVRRDRLEAWLMRPLTPKTVETAVCDGARWLLTGRLSESRGVSGVFDAMPETREVALIFYGVKTRVDPDRDGKYRQRRTVEPHARFMISRKQLKQLNLAALEVQLGGQRCARVARKVLDEVWVKTSR
jgi:hypothetical protein